MDDNEPIYEDIDQLELLLEERTRDNETARTRQPLSSAVTKVNNYRHYLLEF